MRVLMLTPVVPQPTGSGAAIRTWYVLHHLLEEVRAEVSVLAFGSADGPAGGAPLPPAVSLTIISPPARTTGRRLRVLLLSGRPDLADRLWAPEVQARLIWHTLRDDFDLIYLGGLEVGRYVFDMISGMSPSTRPAIVLDEFNAEYVLQLRAWQTDARRLDRLPQAVYSAMQTWRLRAFERSILEAVDAVACVSEGDAQSLQALAPRVDPVVIPNGVETARYAPPAVLPATLPRFDLVFSGTMDYRPNVDAALWFCQVIWPEIRARLPELTLGLVGQRPTAAIRALRSLPGVVVTGGVPDDRPYLWGAEQFVVPMRYGGGSRLKLLNAMAAGCPVIATSMGAEGVTVVHGQHLLLADRPEQWVRAIVRLASEPMLRHQLAANARALVHEQYEWRILVRGFASIYQSLLGRRSIPRPLPNG